MTGAPIPAELRWNLVVAAIPASMEGALLACSCLLEMHIRDDFGWFKVETNT